MLTPRSYASAAWISASGRIASEARAPDHEHENQDEVHLEHGAHRTDAAAAFLELDDLRWRLASACTGRRRAHRDELFLQADDPPHVGHQKAVGEPDAEHVEDDRGDDPRVAEAPGLVAQHDEEDAEHEHGVDEELGNS